MAIALATKFLPYVDELFSTESKKSLLTNNDFEFTNAHTVKIYKIGTAQMTNYGRSGPATGNWSRYGAIVGLDASTEEKTLSKDRSFTFAIDKLDADETVNTLNAASALARQLRQVVIPEIDAYVFNKMCTGAGSKPEAKVLTSDNIYAEIIKGSNALDNAEAPDTGRVLMVTPAVYLLMKQCKDIVMETDIGNDMRIKGVISNLDGMMVMRVPASRLPDKFGFMIAHPVATCAPTKLEDYKIHEDPPGISGSLVEGRTVYDAFVLDNKKNAIYYQATTEPTATAKLTDDDNQNAEVTSPVAVANTGDTLNYTLKVSGLQAGNNVTYTITEVSDADEILTLPATTTGTLSSESDNVKTVFVVAQNATGQDAKTAQFKIAFTGTGYKPIADIEIAVNLAAGA